MLWFWRTHAETQKGRARRGICRDLFRLIIRGKREQIVYTLAASKVLTGKACSTHRNQSVIWHILFGRWAQTKEQRSTIGFCQAAKRRVVIWDYTGSPIIFGFLSDHSVFFLMNWVSLSCTVNWYRYSFIKFARFIVCYILALKSCHPSLWV